MLYKAKTKILFSDYWIDHLVYKPHSDYDLAGHVDAIAIKSESGSVYDFYRSGQIEEPEDFKHTKLYDYYDEVQNLVNCFEIEKTRVRIHRQGPGHIIPDHVDDNNIYAKKPEDLRLRIITALNDNENAVYRFNDEVMTLNKGESVVFEPDKVKHGMENNSTDVPRYALVQIVKVYPFSDWFKNFLYKNNTIDVR